MKRLAAALVTALALAGSAGADVFKVVPNTTTGPVAVPSAFAPNAPGTASFSPTPPAEPERLAYAQLLSLWQRAGAEYGVPWQVLAAINKVESNFGRNMGPSSAGAIGWMQFMPSTWERWGVDANGDGLADPWNAEDAITAAARYLAASGGGADISRAVFSYNHAQWYVDEVLQLARLFDSGGQQMTFTLDRLQVSLDHARRALAKANRRLVAAQRRRARPVGARALAQDTRGPRNAPFRPARPRAAGRAGGASCSRRRRLEPRRLAAPSTVPAPTSPPRRTARWPPRSRPPPGRCSARLRTTAATSSRSAAAPRSSPSRTTITTTPRPTSPRPMGSPVYALANGVVLRSWRSPDPRCGIGMTIRTDDGQTWTYCHLSYLDPSVAAGATLAAGAPVGLVGATGDATGPHLHVQLDPTASYPQDQPWFQSFANVAFRWQDAAPADTSSAGRSVFAVVPTKEPDSGGSVVLFTR